ncbi:hypothetical protein SMW88_003611 [Cronobacter sakazakii]|uniref:hypothetical protein n=1 Tax=Cronobacter sakazakii TaxID=28141 RepID=UPI0013B99666|nr:hypothetical protein [Cronobacter sakazakii]ELY4431868.1 hypothetical protein [Cronobacter sakazakii]ELY4453616.1 hypothetical protein [Cronobacter sakazakii]KAB1488098.1 hypothetical protein FZI22_12205 [Cronobacter sakazakii]
MEWINTNANALIAAGSALLSALVAGGFAVLGSWLSNRQNRLHQNQQQLHEIKRENRKYLLERGEELYEALSKWGKTIAIHHINMMRFAKGLLTKESVNDFIINHNYDYNPDRMNCLLNVYFPDLKLSYQKVNEKRDKANEILTQYEHGNISSEECFKGLHVIGGEFDKAVNCLLNELSQSILGKVK